MDAAVSEYGKLDILINNAGVSQWALVEDITDTDQFETLLQVNYLSVVRCTIAALPHLKKTRGQIVAVSSLAGKAGIPTHSAYSASKHAIHGFLDALRIELDRSGVDVTILCPSFVDTGIRDAAIGPDGRPLGPGNDFPNRVMSVDRCANIMVRAIEAKKREVVMTLQGKLGLWARLVSPAMVDRMIAAAVKKQEPATTAKR